MTSTPFLAAADTVALWHAVEWMATVVREMSREGFKDDEERAQYEAERVRLLAARRALRKVNAIRRAQSRRLHSPGPSPLEAV
ncbi:hypothetical protein [Paracidovorax anthurii]|uniref:Uncharacterized protein n=1 Tax=Paracidovorax anthurii TaxID=78229 RepID=A0A328ZFP6_9BURK|nr:hypothetical protein [Paracidovorax anthurii]RAR84998.1 hypothetical protein AX018_100891 [Paracidovorax anthurii]